MPIAWSGTLLITFIPTYYAIELGLGLGLVGGLFVAGRLLDVITDPLIGHGSDRTRSRYGARIPWMIVGAVLFIPLLLLLLFPNEAVSPIQAGVLIGLFFLAFTVLDLPYSATGLEMSPHRHERTTLASVKAVFQIAGAMAAAVMVALHPEDIAHAFAQSGGLISGFILLGVILFIGFTPTYAQPIGRPLAMKTALAMIWADQRYRNLMGAFFLTQTGSALIFGLTALFILNHFGNGVLTGLFIILILVSTAITLPVWLWASKRIGKAKCWKVALIGGAATLWLVPFLEPGNSLHYGVFCVLVGSALGADAVFPTSVLADISDDMTTQESGNAAMMLGYKNALSKLGFVAPMGLAFPILGALGFDDVVAVEDSRRWALIFFYALLPALLRCGAFLIVKGMVSAKIKLS
jgi:GPH family glycoside/pentoside/hexuronide:cation symporter